MSKRLRNAATGVTAIDWSPAMVEEAQSPGGAPRLEEQVDVHHLGIHELDRLPPGSFDAAYSNFGPLNCVPSLPDAVGSSPIES